MLSKTQTLEGISSKVVDEPEEKHLHFIFWDLEGCTRAEAVKLLREIQLDFKLGDIFIFSDCEGSYRAWCWSKRPWIKYLHVLIHTFPLLDYGFWVWTVRRGAATLRITDKMLRQHQGLVAVLKGYEKTVLPKKVVHVRYDTGIEKRGKVISLG